MAAEPGDSGGVCRWPATTIGSGAADRDRRPRDAPGEACRRAACGRRQASRPRNADPRRAGARAQFCLRNPRAPRGSASTMRSTPPAMTGTSISTSTHGQGSSRAFARSPAARRSVARGANAVPAATRHRRRRAAPTGGIENWQGGHGVSSQSHSGQSPLPYQRSAHLAVRSRCRFAPTQRKSDGSLSRRPTVVLGGRGDRAEERARCFGSAGVSLASRDQPSDKARRPRRVYPPDLGVLVRLRGPGPCLRVAWCPGNRRCWRPLRRLASGREPVAGEGGLPRRPRPAASCGRPRSSASSRGRRQNGASRCAARSAALGGRSPRRSCTPPMAAAGLCAPFATRPAATR